MTNLELVECRERIFDFCDARTEEELRRDNKSITVSEYYEKKYFTQISIVDAVIFNMIIMGYRTVEINSPEVKELFLDELQYFCSRPNTYLK